jgi:hypothetical protein
MIVDIGTTIVTANDIGVALANAKSHEVAYVLMLWLSQQPQNTNLLNKFERIVSHMDLERVILLRELLDNGIQKMEENKK